MNVCNGQLDGTGNPNYCNGVLAKSQCATCIGDTCGSQLMSCASN